MPEPGIVWFGATAGCDHRGCHGRGPYHVLCVGTDNMVGIMHACVYSSQAAGSRGIGAARFLVGRG